MQFVSISSLQRTTKPMLENDVVCVMKNNEPVFYTVKPNLIDGLLTNKNEECCISCNSKDIDWRVSKVLNGRFICSKCSELISESFNESVFGGKPSKKKISEMIRHSVYSRDGWCCLTCGSTDDLTCDHIIPESRGGETSVHNLQTLCRSCNSKKGVK